MSMEDVLKEVRPRFVTEIAELWPPQKEWTEENYFGLPDTNRFLELSEGELIMPPHPTPTHQRTVLRLATDFQSFLQAHDLGILYIAPLPVRLWTGKIREPDILFFTHAHADRIGEQACGPPDLAVEVISPTTEHTDRGEKFAEYARAGIFEYWLVDPNARAIEVYALRGSAYQLLAKAGPGEKVYSQLLEGFEINADDLFAG